MAWTRIVAAGGLCLMLAGCGAPSSRYATALSAGGNFAILTDGKTGDTWVMKGDGSGKVSWIPVVREGAPAKK